MKLKNVKLANSVKVGQDENSFWTDVNFDITIERSVIIQIRAKRPDHKGVHAKASTSLFNAIYWTEDEVTERPNTSDESTPVEPGSPSAPRRGRKGEGTS